MNLEELILARSAEIERQFLTSAQQNVEIEARFHEYYMDGISLTTFSRIKNLDFLSKTPSVLEYSKDIVYPNNIRSRIVYLTNAEPYLTVISKQNLAETELLRRLKANYGIKFNIAVENPLPNNYINPKLPYDYLREKTRYSYNIALGIRLDLTEITEIKYGTNDKVKKYECEIEFDRKISVPDYKNVILWFWNLIHNTRLIYSIPEYMETVSLINIILTPNITKSDFKYKTEISSQPLFQMRNLHFEDLTAPGIINGKIVTRTIANTTTLENNPVKRYQYIENPVTYRITHKTDGERKLLVFTKDGTYLVSAPYSVNKIAGPYAILTGTILEGELIPMEQRIRNYPREEIWYLIYDALSITYDIVKQNLNPGFPGSSGPSGSTDLITPGSNKSIVDGRKISEYILSLNQAGRNLATAIQNKSHGERIAECNNTLTIIKQGNIIPNALIETKEFGDKCMTKESIFKRVIELREKMKNLAYKTDGLIFMPFETGYLQEVQITKDDRTIIQRVDRLSLPDRKLSLYPDVMKWKDIMTIDLRYVYNPNSMQIMKISLPATTSTNSSSIEILVPTEYELLFSVTTGSESKNLNQMLTSGTTNKDFSETTSQESKHLSATNKDFYTQILTKYPNEDLFRGSFLSPIDKIEIDFTNQKLNNVPSSVIIEVLYDTTEKKFIPLKIRDDKPKPNNQEFVEDNWKMISDPIEVETLSGDGIRLLRKYHSRIKTNLLDYPFQSSVGKPTTEKEILNLLDLGSGNFGDVTKMSKYSKVILVEPNLDYIKNGLIRINNFYNYTPVIIYKTDDSRTILRKIGEANELLFSNVKFKHLVINCGIEDTALITFVTDKFFTGKADVISMMLSMSFFWNEQIFPNMVETLRQNITSQGKILFFTLDGQNVFQTFPTAVQSDDLVKILSFAGGRHEDPLQVSVNRNGLYIDLKTPTVNSQYENYVFLDDLRIKLIKNNLFLTSQFRADQEIFLNDEEYKLSSLYSYGYFEANLNGNVILSIGSDRENRDKYYPEIQVLPEKLSNIKSDNEVDLVSDLSMLTLNPGLEISSTVAKSNIPLSVPETKKEGKKQIATFDLKSLVPKKEAKSFDLKSLVPKTGNLAIPNTIKSVPNPILPEIKLNASKYGDLENIPENIFPYAKAEQNVLVDISTISTTSNVSNLFAKTTIPNPIPVVKEAINPFAKTTIPAPIPNPVVKEAINPFAKTTIPAPVSIPSVKEAINPFAKTTTVSVKEAINPFAKTTTVSVKEAINPFAKTTTVSVKEPINPFVTTTVSTSVSTPINPFVTATVPLTQQEIKLPVPKRQLLGYLSVSPQGGDDVKHKINVKKYPNGNIVRISTIGDGSCLIHAALKSFLYQYMQSDYNNRKNIVKTLRNEMAAALSFRVNGKTFYETFMNGSWIDLAVQQYIAKVKSEDLQIEFDPTLIGLQTKLLSNEFLGDEAYNYLSYIIKLQIIVVKGYVDDIEFIVMTEVPNLDKAIIILGNEAHFELVGEVTPQGTKTIFEISDPLVQAIINK